jgi:O-antigen ligase
LIPDTTETKTAATFRTVASTVRGLRAAWNEGPGALQGPAVLDAALIGLWFAGRLADAPELATVAVVAAAASALQWPATAATLAGMVLLFPDGGRHVAPGLVLVAAAGIGELVWSVRSRRPLGVDWIVIAVALLLATTALALFATLGGATASDAVRSSLRWIGLASGLLILPIQLFLIQRGAIRPTLLLGCGVVAALGLALLAQVVPSILEQTPVEHLLSTVQSDRATGPFDSPNRLGSVAGMALLVALVWIMSGIRPRTRAILIGVAAVAGAALLLSFSRGAILGVGVAVSVILGLRSTRLGLAVAAVLLVIGIVAGPFVIAARLGFNTNSRPAVLAADDAERLAAWRAGVQMFLSAPLTGHGYGSFAWIASSPGDPATLQTAHNEVIGLLAEAGLPAGFAFVAIFAIVLVRSLRAPPGSLMALGAATVFVVATMFNIQSIYPQVAVVLWTCVAYGVVVGRSNDRLAPPRDAVSASPPAKRPDME